MDVCMYVWIDGWMHECMDECLDEGMQRYGHGGTGGWGDVGTQGHMVD